MMAVSLFTFRELLRLLGVDDYGTYNVVGGVVILFSFLSNAMTQSNQRFLSYHIGKGNKGELQRIFSMIINVQLLLGLIILILAETVGLWFINTKMNFAQEKMMSVNLVYQFSILTFIIQILQIPYTSSIVSHERMDFFSYVSIGEALLRLGVVLALALLPSGRLVAYAMLLSISALIMFLINYVYCTKKFSICKYHRFWNKAQFKELTSFSGWNMLGGLGTVGSSQGINILFNIFCGVVVNAAMGVSHQVSAAVGSLVGNMQMAFNPQIIKSYASGEIQYFNSLIFRASRISFLLILIIGVPIIACANEILSIWLTDVPQYAVSFTQLTIAYCMVDSLAGPLWTANQASGRVRTYMIIVSILILLNIPLGYLVLSKGWSPIFVMLIRVILCFIVLNFRIFYLKNTIEFPYRQFYSSVILRAFVAFTLCILIYYVCRDIIDFTGIKQIIFLGGSLFLFTTIIGYLVLLNSTERFFITNKVKSYICKWA